MFTSSPHGPFPPQTSVWQELHTAVCVEPVLGMCEWKDGRTRNAILFAGQRFREDLKVEEDPSLFNRHEFLLARLTSLGF